MKNIYVVFALLCSLLCATPLLAAGAQDMDKLAQFLVDDPKFVDAFTKAMEKKKQTVRSTEATKSNIINQEKDTKQILSTALPEDQKADLFFSLRCSYCWELWNKMVKDERIYKYMASNNFHIKPLVDSEATGFPIVIYEAISSQNKVKALEFMTFLQSLSLTVEDDVFRSINTWLVKNNFKGLEEFRKTVDAATVQSSLEGYIKEFNTLSLKGTPAIVVDGKEDPSFLLKFNTKN